MSRADRKREEKAKERRRIYIPIPDEFLDVEGDTWKTALPGSGVKELDFVGVLAHTIRRLPVKTGHDAERNLDILSSIKAVGDNDKYLVLEEDDYNWMVEQMKEHGHLVWLAPDSAYLVRRVKNTSQTGKPKDFEESTIKEVGESSPS